MGESAQRVTRDFVTGGSRVCRQMPHCSALTHQAWQALGPLSRAHMGAAGLAPLGPPKKPPRPLTPRPTKPLKAHRPAWPHHHPGISISPSSFPAQVMTMHLRKLDRLATLKWRRRSRNTFPNFQKELSGIINQHITNTQGLFYIRRHIILKNNSRLVCFVSKEC